MHLTMAQVNPSDSLTKSQRCLLVLFLHHLGLRGHECTRNCVMPCTWCHQLVYATCSPEFIWIVWQQCDTMRLISPANVCNTTQPVSLHLAISVTLINNTLVRLSVTWSTLPNTDPVHLISCNRCCFAALNLKVRSQTWKLSSISCLSSLCCWWPGNMEYAYVSANSDEPARWFLNPVNGEPLCLSELRLSPSDWKQLSRNNYERLRAVCN